MNEDIKKYIDNQTIEQTNEENQHQQQFNNNNDYDLLLSSIYIISQYTKKYNFNEIVLILGLEDIIYNGL